MKIDFYTKENCPFCFRAKTLLDHYNLEYNEYTFPKDFSKGDLKLIISDDKKPLTVPQIVINDELIGGFHELEKYFEKVGTPLDNL